MAEIFRLKQFDIQQEHSAHKVGTDGMLLGAFVASHFANTPPARILDVGTGTGLIALMLAQAFPESEVTAIELDPLSACEARSNAAHSPFADRVTIIEDNFGVAELSGSYQLITSNPPYYTPTHQNSDIRETQAKHAITLTPETFFGRSQELLSPEGTIATVLACTALPDFMVAAAEFSFAPVHQAYIHTKAEKEAKRVITLWQHNTASTTEAHLTILAGEGRHQYTPEYAHLLRPYLTIL